VKKRVLLTLRAARTNLGLSRKDAAKLFNISPDVMASYEYDSTNVPRTFLINIEKLYGVSIDQIYFGKEKEHYSDLRNQLEIRQHA
jgi:transcriptional regulator with XRE-family HTH domain